ncbi:TPA: hypothetical protein NIV73_003691 [Klebsiella pneumoniae]|uniref:DUF7946 domain-containing protein n=1 Tax=Klebsiella pneumoniae TaxID=573 RepID=UPI00065099BC|nr:hypothetical protein [Klebsiella pneumoniae]EIW3880658.1 hypothetical protein [Klebsiella pneumoniae]KMB49831.1 hypothetical protein SL56_01174 [Klebsiella pneumoniae]HBX7697732.1 hypothetical protein [Klebsiella pneumoniae]HCC2960205.1 hypothetical protein [Klebsiella pneumoniae]HCF8504413.1 hypothetical protein [Klebsiella pneumoniae]
MDGGTLQDIKISLRYDGKDALNHEIDLNCLGESLKGFSKVLSTAASFSATQKYSKYVNYQEVKVYAREAKANCFTLDAALNFVTQNQLFSGIAATILGAMLQYIFARNSNKKDEMKALQQSLEKAIEALGNKDAGTIDKLIAVIDRMAVELRPSVRQAVSPIGNTCDEISIATNVDGCLLKVNEHDKAEIDKLDDDEVIGLREYRAFLTEFDAHNMTAKIILEGDDSNRRIASEISDPSASKKNNPYINALGSYISTKGDPSSVFTITAKATVKKGQINRLFIVDAK